MEIDLDRHADIHININIYKLLMQDNHKKSKIAEPFRVRNKILYFLDDSFQSVKFAQWIFIASKSKAWCSWFSEKFL